MAVKAYFFLRQNGRCPVDEYLKSINDQRRLAAIQKAIERLMEWNGRLPEPIAKHVEGKIWELRTRFGSRVFYFIQQGPIIIFLDGYTNKRDRIEPYILARVRNLYREYLAVGNRKPYYK